MTALLLFLLFAGSTRAEAHTSATVVPDSELALRGIAVGDTEAVVLRRLGPPMHRMDTGDFMNRRFDYRNMTIYFAEGRVEELFTRDYDSCTPSKACPGMSFDRIKRIYGRPLVVKRETGTFMEYPGSRSACWLQFSFRDQIAQSIAIKCLP